MINTRDLKRNDIVFVKKLSATHMRYQLDSAGDMQKMKGRYFPIKEISGETSIRIYNEDAGTTFIFDIQDIERPDPEPLEPKIFEFDTSHLDI